MRAWMVPALIAGFLLILGWSSSATAQAPAAEAATPNAAKPLVIVLDGSGSMATADQEGKTRFTVALQKASYPRKLVTA